MQPHIEFEAVVQAHSRSVQRVCSSILRDEHLGADAAQETFVRLWRRIQEGREPDEIVTWLRRVAVTTSLDASRARARRAASVVTDVDVEMLPEPRRNENTVDEAVLRARFERAVNELSEGQRTVFMLKHEGGLSLSEVAKALDVALPTVKTQFARAVLKLQDKLASFRPAGDPQ